MLKFGAIGVGNMTTAILSGMLKAEVIKANEVMLCDKHPEQHNSFYQAGVTLAEDAVQVVENCQFVMLAVKPQGFSDLLANIKGCKNKPVFISIAAGISAKFIKDALGYDAKIILVMPNTPILLGCGTSAVSRVEPTSQEEFLTAKEFFASCGEAVEIAPTMMNEVIPLNGSSPAFIYKITQIFVANAVEMGFDEQTAKALFCNTLIGAANMMSNTEKSLDELIKAVCSKGGTTIAGLDAMAENGLDKALSSGIKAAVTRAYELGK